MNEPDKSKENQQADYFELDFRLYPVEPFRDLLIHYLMNEGYDAFLETEAGLMTYAPIDHFQEQQLHEILQRLEAHDCQISYRKKPMPIINWNQPLEQQLPIVHVNADCVIAQVGAVLEPGIAYPIFISPHLSFGTGHHPTTFLMLQQMMLAGMQNKIVYDVGCGTGVLSILAEKMGAKAVHAVDIDPFAYENTLANLAANNCCKVQAWLGTLPTLPINNAADIILANISRNILIEEMPLYAKLLQPNGQLLTSGFLERDYPILIDAAQQVGLQPFTHDSLDSWMFVLWQKKLN